MQGRSRPLKAFDFDQASCLVWILGDESGESRGGLEPIQQAAGQSAMQRAHHRLVGVDRFAIRAVAQSISDSPYFGALALRREPQRGQGTAQRLLGSRAGLIARQLTTELASGALDLAQAPRASRSAARKPPAEQGHLTFQASVDLPQLRERPV